MHSQNSRVFKTRTNPVLWYFESGLLNELITVNKLSLITTGIEGLERRAL